MSIIRADLSRTIRSCMRCGAPASWEGCFNCDHRGHDDGEVCAVCRGAAGAWACSASAEHCAAHPIAGREIIPRGKITEALRPPLITE